MKEYIEDLKTLYEKLRSNYVRNSTGRPNKSVFCALLHLSSKAKRMRLLLESAAPATALKSANVLEELLRLKYIEWVDQKGNICITAKGLWLVEKEQRIISEDKLLDFISIKWFNLFSDTRQPLNDKEKLILFVALTLRTFSKDSAIQTNYNKQINDGWKDVIVLCSKFLYENQVIHDKQVSEELSRDKKKKSTALHPVSHFFRYSEKLPKKTNTIFIAHRNNYYLNLHNENGVEKQKIIFLFELVLGAMPDYELTQKIVSFCQKTSYDKNIHVFTLGKHIFATPAFDDLMSESLHQLLLKSS